MQLDSIFSEMAMKVTEWYNKTHCSVTVIALTSQGLEMAGEFCFVLSLDRFVALAFMLLNDCLLL